MNPILFFPFHRGTLFIKHIASVVPFLLYNSSDKNNPNWKNQENIELSKYIIVF